MIQEEDTSKFLEEATPWERLSPSAQAYFGTPGQYQQRILDYSFDHQKPWDAALTFIQPGVYYQKLIDFGIEKFLVFPYHLIGELQKYNPSVPFRYYGEMLLKVMATDRAYQTIPNFSAAEALRVTGVGRNQFIDAMNKSRAGGVSSILQSKDKRLRALLPQAPTASRCRPGGSSIRFRSPTSSPSCPRACGRPTNRLRQRRARASKWVRWRNRICAVCTMSVWCTSRCRSRRRTPSNFFRWTTS
jgi:hypothetical protein